MASWTALEEQVVRISARATAFTIVCSACAQAVAAEGYGAASVAGSMPIERLHGTLVCPRGHRLHIERDPP
jgi:hypothetical protein